MPTFIPVTDHETPRSERNNYSKDAMKHRQFDAMSQPGKPGRWSGKKKKKKKVDRGWAMGSVGWGVRGTFGNDEIDDGSHIVRKKDPSKPSKLYRDEHGNWVQRRYREPAATAKAKKKKKNVAPAGCDWLANASDSDDNAGDNDEATASSVEGSSPLNETHGVEDSLAAGTSTTTADTSTVPIADADAHRSGSRSRSRSQSRSGRDRGRARARDHDSDRGHHRSRSGSRERARSRRRRRSRSRSRSRSRNRNRNPVSYTHLTLPTIYSV